MENKRLDEGAARDGPNPVVNEAATSIPEDHPRRRKGVDASTPDILRQRGNGSLFCFIEKSRLGEKIATRPTPPLTTDPLPCPFSRPMTTAVEPTSVKKAVILSAGMGTRLGALTQNLPKVMVPIAGKPMLEHHLEWLKGFGVSEFYLNLHYLADVISDYFEDGSRWDVKIHYHREERLLGTAGSLQGFRPYLDETFLVQYGDVFSRLDLARLALFHRQHEAAASLVVHPSSHPHDSDIIELADETRIRQIHHKPGDARFGNLGNAGAYLLEPVVLDHLSPDLREEDFCKDVFPRMLAAGETVCGYDTDDLLLDVGTPERLAWIEEHLKSA